MRSVIHVDSDDDVSVMPVNKGSACCGYKEVECTESAEVGELLASSCHIGTLGVEAWSSFGGLCWVIRSRLAVGARAYTAVVRARVCGLATWVNDLASLVDVGTLFDVL